MRAQLDFCQECKDGAQKTDDRQHLHKHTENRKALNADLRYKDQPAADDHRKNDQRQQIQQQRQ